MKTTLQTLAANLKHGALSRTDAQIGGGAFTPEEQLALCHALGKWQQLLEEATLQLKCIDTQLRRAELIDRIERAIA